MAFIELISLEWLLLLAAGMTLMGGIRGTLAAMVILSGIMWQSHPDDFWIWEIFFLIGVVIAIGILLSFVHKAGKSELVTGMAGGLASLIVLGAFFTPLIALFSWALIVGTGLIPRLKRKQVLWGLAPMLWRIVMGLGWIILGNIAF